MASTSHGLSVYANTCVKNPLNPKTGLSSTLPERSKITIRFKEGFDQVDGSLLLGATIPGDGRDWTRETLQGKDVNSRLQAASEEEFYNKLQHLKEENKRTIEAYEKLYKEKVLLDGIRNGQSSKFKPDKSGVDRDINNSANTFGIDVDVHESVDEPVTKKPPPGKPLISSSEGPSLSNTMTHRSDPIIRLSSKPSLVRSSSLGEGDLKLQLRDSRDFTIFESNKVEYEKALDKVDKLWEDFSISEYTQKRRHSFSASEGKKTKSKKPKEWRHRITIPEPFTMSVREALKEKTRTKAQEELERRRLEKEKLEEEECAKKFKAQPVPSHVYLPLYEGIMEEKESRRKYVKEYCQQMLQSQVKPFNFELREEEKKNQRAMSAPVKRSEKPIKSNFKAKPVPKKIFNPKIDEKLQEEEELRKIRVRMRAKETLRESSLPPNMAERERYKEQKRIEDAKKVKKASASTKKRRPKSAQHAVPDYDLLYREFHKELARRKTIKEGTVIQPFEIEPGRTRQSVQEKVKRQMEEDEQYLKENRWPYTGARTTPRSSMKYLGIICYHLIIAYCISYNYL